MDIEKVQKINELVAKLQSQRNLSREEAVKQAEQILSKDGVLEITEISREKVKEMDKKEEKVDFKEVLAKNTEFMVKQIKEFNEQIDGFRQEIGILKAKIGDLAKKLEKGSVLKGEREKERPREGEKPKEEEKSEPHPRRGNYTEEDVAIDKIFYTGTKRKE